jgi:GNAT superfamily N-acetyltransferase
VIVPDQYGSPALRELLAGLAGHYVSAYGAHDLADDDPAEYAAPAGGCLVGYEDGSPVAVGCWRYHAPGVCELRRFYVSPHARGWGIGRLMVAAVTGEAAASGYRRALCATAAGDVLAGLDVRKIRPYGPHSELSGVECYEVRLDMLIDQSRSFVGPMQSHGKSSSDIRVA